MRVGIAELYVPVQWLKNFESSKGLTKLTAVEFSGFRCVVVIFVAVVCYRSVAEPRCELPF